MFPRVDAQHFEQRLIQALALDEIGREVQALARAELFLLQQALRQHAGGLDVSGVVEDHQGVQRQAKLRAAETRTPARLWPMRPILTLGRTLIASGSESPCSSPVI